MGQQISKRLVVPKLTNAMKSYEAEVAKDAMEDIARRQAIAKAKGQRYIDPSAQDGFRRDTWGHESVPQDVNQTNFLTSQQGKHEDMPKDLIDFLNDIGPLERKVSKDMTSEKVYESLLDEEEQKRQQLQEARQRKRRRMPMIETDHPIEGDQVEAMTVERTTNFSQAEREIADGLHLSDKELFDLVLALKENKMTAAEYLAQQFPQNNEVNDKYHDENFKLLENIKYYNEVPVLMQDTDKSLVGASKNKIDTLKLAKVRMAPSFIQLTLGANKNDNMASKKDKLKKGVVLK